MIAIIGNKVERTKFLTFKMVVQFSHGDCDTTTHATNYYQVTAEKLGSLYAEIKRVDECLELDRNYPVPERFAGMAFPYEHDAVYSGYARYERIAVTYFDEAGDEFLVSFQ